MAVFLTCDELARFAHVCGARGFVGRTEADPLLHRPPLAGVEDAALAARDQLGDAIRRKLDYDLGTRDKGEELPRRGIPEAGRREHLAALDAAPARGGA